MIMEIISGYWVDRINTWHSGFLTATKCQESLPDFRCQWFTAVCIRRGRKLGVLGKLGESVFQGFQLPSFPFCTIPKTEKSELKTSEICSEVVSSNSEVLWSNSEVFLLRLFHFALHSKRKTRRWKTSEFSRTPSDQTPRFSISDFSVLSVVQSGKLGVGKPRSLIK